MSKIRLHFVATEEQKLQWKQAADEDRRSLSDWIRIQLDRAVEREERRRKRR